MPHTRLPPGQAHVPFTREREGVGAVAANAGIAVTAAAGKCVGGWLLYMYVWLGGSDRGDACLHSGYPLLAGVFWAPPSTNSALSTRRRPTPPSG